jgi:hypothetical protein
LWRQAWLAPVAEDIGRRSGHVGSCSLLTKGRCQALQQGQALEENGVRGSMALILNTISFKNLTLQLFKRHSL